MNEIKGPSTVKLYSILHVGRQDTRHLNLGAKAGDPMDVYLKCAGLLQSSCKANGQSFAVITNNAALVLRRASALGLDIEAIEHEFDRAVPTGIDFYSAHFKLDVFKAFGTGIFGEFLGLIDIDAVLVHPFPTLSETKDDELLVYDITNHVVPEYGTDRIADDLRRLGAPASSIPSWAVWTNLIKHRAAAKLTIAR